MMLKEFGQDLKNLRESKNITIAEISAQTRINPKFINFIESGIFDFQPDTYMRAFLREYARCISENEAQLLVDYEKAKSGFYVRKGKKKEETGHVTEKPIAAKEEKVTKTLEQTAAPKPRIPPEQQVSPSYFQKEEESRYLSELSGKKWMQRVLLGLLIVVIIISVIYMLNYLNSSSNEETKVIPKTFEEIEDDYKTKIKGKTGKDTVTLKEESTVTSSADSLKLTVRAAKDVRIKVYLDENQVVEYLIPAKDSINITAKEQFRFSASANSSIDLYLNGKYLKKPSYLTGTTIKNLIINKDGIVQE
jgi:cytoskeletal protein RodZ